ncbi:hypothetical protein GGX14DRAFT_584069 [Mycena pura]|uniref:Uncharacterized protein n=1 Tax=Mycena pura TaxID=153505 RepID=A0AAD6YVM7_9AGAR|nr:hypothetical protein GGX14DRAFT_584069 [Mycena pura]
MVAIHPHFALVAVSLVSLSLAPSADAAAINSRSAGPESSSKSLRQLPMPLRARKSATKDGLKTKPGRGFGESRRRQFLKSRTGGVESLLGEARRQEQVHFSTKNRGHAEARDVPQCTSGHVNITRANSDGSSMPIGYLVLNNDTTPPELDASTTSQTILELVQFDDSHCTLRKDIYVPAQNQTITHCATYNRQPLTPEPLKMCPCDAPATCGPNASQDFSYDSDTGVIQPIWSDGGSNNDTSTASADSEDVNDPDTNDAEMDDGDNGDSDSALAARDTPPTNVTLVWVPEECPVSAQEVTSDSQSSASSATMTETITTTVTATMYSSSAADADTPSSTTDSSSQLTSTVSPVPSPSALNVELAVPSSTDPADAATSTGTTATSPGSSAIASDTVNPGTTTTSSDSSAPSSMTPDTVAPSDAALTSSPSPTASADAAAEPTSSVAPQTSEDQALYVANARGAAEW